MSKIIEFKIKDIQPEREVVFKEFGIPKIDLVSKKIQQEQRTLLPRTRKMDAV